MRHESIVTSRLDRIIRLDAAEKVEFREKIERARVVPFARLDLGLEPVVDSRSDAGNPEKNSLEPSFQPSLPVESLFYSLQSEIGDATSFTLGLITLSSREFSISRNSEAQLKHPLAALIEEMAQKLERRTCCVHVGPSIKDNEHSGMVHYSSQSQVAYRHWDIQLSRRHREYSQGLDLQSHLHQLPNMKKQYPLVVLELGPIDQPWTEGLARLCDAVYLAIPSMGALQPLKAIASVRRLKQANVRVSGSWTVRAA